VVRDHKSVQAPKNGKNIEEWSSRDERESSGAVERRLSGSCEIPGVLLALSLGRACGQGVETS
jgi:hypothetical protein